MPRYGFEGALHARPGRGPRLEAVLLRAAELMKTVPECEIYIVGTALGSPDIVRVTEVWTSKPAHDQSLALPQVKALLDEAMPLIATTPSGLGWSPSRGKGLSD